MKVTCPQCSASFNIDASKIPAKGARLRCAKCRELFTAAPAAQEAMPLPGAGAPRVEDTGAAPSEAVPLPAPEPGADAPVHGGTERTRAPPVPLPGAALDELALSVEAEVLPGSLADDAAFEALFESEADGEEALASAADPRTQGTAPFPQPESVTAGASAADIELEPDDAAGEIFDPFAPPPSPADEAISLPAPADGAVPLPEPPRAAIALPDVAPALAGAPAPGPAAEVAQAVALPAPSGADPTAAIALADGSALDEAALFGPGPIALPEDESGGRALDLGAAGPALEAAAEPVAFDALPQLAVEGDAALPGVALADEGEIALDTGAPVAGDLQGAPTSLSAAGAMGAGDAGDAAAAEDVAEAFLKSLSGSIMKGAADSLSSLDGPDSDGAPPDEPGALPGEDQFGAAAGAAEVAADPTAPEPAGESLSDEAILGPSAALDPPPEAPADFASMLTFNSSHERPAPSAAAPAISPSGDLELDLAAVQRPAPQDDKLEVLDFIEEREGPEASGAPALDGSSYFIRRQAEKPRGPFEMLAIIYMISSGQLLGDEEVSQDQERWTPITSVRAFAEAIEQLMASPGDVTFAVDNVAESLAQQKDEALERIKARYGDRIADIAIVTSEEKAKLRLSPGLAICLAVLLLALGGASLGLTSYGPFAIHWLFPKEIKAGTPEHLQFLQASEALCAGTWFAGRRALALAEALLESDPSLIEPRALYAQSAFYLQRIYRTDADKRGRAERYLRELSADDGQSARSELLKAQVAFDLLRKNTSRRAALEAHLGAHPEDRAAAFLLSDLLAVAGDTPGAVRALEGLLEAQPGNARALRQIGLLLLAEEVPEAEWVEVAIEGGAEAASDAPARAGETALAAAAESETEAANAPARPEETAPAFDAGLPEAGAAADVAGPAPRAPVARVSPKVLEALAYFDRALEADPEDAESILSKADVLTRHIPRPREALGLLARLDAGELSAQLSPPDRARAGFLRGLDHMALRQYGEAFAAFDEAMEAAPDNVEIPALYGKIVLNQGDDAKAEALFARARAAEPDNLLHLDGQVRALIGQEKFHQAQTLLTEALEENPQSTRLALLQGRVFDELGKEKEAIESYQKALADEAVGWEAAFYLGGLYLKRGRLDEAKAAIDRALDKGGSHAKPHVGLGRYLLTTRALDAAFDAFERAIEIDGDDAEAHFGMAEVLTAQGQLTAAERSFARATAINEKLPGLETRYGSLLWRLGQREEAAKALEKARALDFRDAEALWKLGAIYFELKRYDQAFESLSSALAAEPGQVDALFYKARVQYERQETTQALQTIRSALERNRDRADLHYWAGKIYSQAQKYTEAEVAWLEAIRLDPDGADAMESLARTYQEQGEFGHAVDFFKKVLEVAPKRQELNFNIAECLFSMNRYQEAIAHYEKMIAFDSTFKEAYFKIGRCYNEMNQLDRAIKWYDKAIQLDAKYAEAWMLLGYAHKEKFRYRQAIKAFENYLSNASNKKDIKTIETEIIDLKALL